jgi:hypothetical protein
MKLVQVYRVTVFVPPAHLDRLLKGILATTDLRHGSYDQSAWWFGPGTEQFRPLPGSSATSGTVGATSREPTIRLEFSLPHDARLLQRVIDTGLVPNHPWEEPEVLVEEMLELRPNAAR